MTTWRCKASWLVHAFCAALTTACAHDAAHGAGSASAAERSPSAPENDHALCDYKGRPDREVSESAAHGALGPSIRRVYRLVGEGADRKRILICREVDTNLDGIKDLVRRYDDQGQVIEEDADSNYDGKVDTWTYYFRGRIARVEVDLDGDDTPDETRYYVQGKLSRVQRDTNHDGRPDVWEIYADGHLERIGVDLDHDGRVDRWSRDQSAAKFDGSGSSGADAESAAKPPQ